MNAGNVPVLFRVPILDSEPRPTGCDQKNFDVRGRLALSSAHDTLNPSGASQFEIMRETFVFPIEHRRDFRGVTIGFRTEYMAACEFNRIFVLAGREAPLILRIPGRFRLSVEQLAVGNPEGRDWFASLRVRDLPLRNERRDR